jgi:hypothetical protein
MAKPSSAKEQDNLVCQDVIRNGLDRAVDVTQTLRDGAPSAQDLTSRPASGRLTAFLKLDVKQLRSSRPSLIRQNRKRISIVHFRSRASSRQSPGNSAPR